MCGDLHTHFSPIILIKFFFLLAQPFLSSRYDDIIFRTRVFGAGPKQWYRYNIKIICLGEVRTYYSAHIVDQGVNGYELTIEVE